MFKLKKLVLLCSMGLFVSTAYADVDGKIKERNITPDIAQTLPKTPVFDVPSHQIQSIYQDKLPNNLLDLPVNKGVSNPTKVNLDYGVLNDEDFEDQWLASQLYDIEPQAKKELPPDLATILDYDPVDELANQITAERYQMISEAASSFGMQSGFARQQALIARALEDRSVALDNTYNFQRFMLPSNVLPPIVVKTTDLFEQQEDAVIHIGLHNYKILSDARLVYTPPNWRGYLLFDASRVPKPTLMLDKKIKAERKLWNEAVSKGYRRGVTMANRNLDEAFRALTRDYVGIIDYHIMVKNGAVSLPYVTVDSRDIVGNGRDMTVGDTVLRIAVKPEFVLNRNEWVNSMKKGQKGYIGGKGEGADVLEYKGTSRKSQNKTKATNTGNNKASKGGKTKISQQADTKVKSKKQAVVKKNVKKSTTKKKAVVTSTQKKSNTQKRVSAEGSRLINQSLPKPILLDVEKVISQ